MTNPQNSPNKDETPIEELCKDEDVRNGFSLDSINKLPEYFKEPIETLYKNYSQWGKEKFFLRLYDKLGNSPIIFLASLDPVSLFKSFDECSRDYKNKFEDIERDSNYLRKYDSYNKKDSLSEVTFVREELDSLLRLEESFLDYLSKIPQEELGKLEIYKASLPDDQKESYHKENIEPLLGSYNQLIPAMIINMKSIINRPNEGENVVRNKIGNVLFYTRELYNLLQRTQEASGF